MLVVLFMLVSGLILANRIHVNNINLDEDVKKAMNH